MKPLLRPAAALSLEPGGPLHFGSGDVLDPMSMMGDGHSLWEVDPAAFVGQLGRHARELFMEQARSANPLRACHGFMREQPGKARAAARAGVPLFEMTAAVAQAYENYLRSAVREVPRLALAREDTLGPQGRIAAVHVRGSMAVAWRGTGRQDPLPLRATDCVAQAGSVVPRAAMAGRLRTDTPRPVPIPRRTQWFVAGCPEPGTRHAGVLGPAVPGQASWDGALHEVVSACNAYYRPRLQAVAAALQASAAGAGDTPLARFVAWAQHALACSAGDESAFLLQVGGFAGSGAHPDTGDPAGPARINVCMTAAGPRHADLVQGAQPMGWLLARVAHAANVGDTQALRLPLPH